MKCQEDLQLPILCKVCVHLRSSGVCDVIIIKIQYIGSIFLYFNTYSIAEVEYNVFKNMKRILHIQYTRTEKIILYVLYCILGLNKLVYVHAVRYFMCYRLL